jgi:hypothetical protein
MPILVIKDGKQYGPYEFTDLVGYVSQGSFALTDLCWQDGWKDWQPLSSIISIPPPPAAPAQVQLGTPLPAMQSYPPVSQRTKKTFSSEPRTSLSKETTETSALAITSLVFGILGFVFFGLTSIIAIICGHISLKHIKKSGGALQGHGLAITGLILGYISFGILFLLMLIIIPNIIAIPTR